MIGRTIAHYKILEELGEGGMGDYDRCFECLGKAVDNGFAHRVWVENDPDLEPIRKEGRYKTLLERL